MRRLPAEGLNGGMIVTGDGRHVVVGDFTRGLAFYDAATLESVAQSSDPSVFGTYMVPTADGRGVAATSYPTEPDGPAEGAVFFFDAATGAALRPPLEGLPTSPVANSLAMSNDGRYLAVSLFGENDPPAPVTQMVWDLSAPDAPPVRFAFGVGNPDMAFAGQRLVIASGD